MNALKMKFGSAWDNKVTLRLAVVGLVLAVAALATANVEDDEGKCLFSFSFFFFGGEGVYTTQSSEATVHVLSFITRTHAVTHASFLCVATYPDRHMNTHTRTHAFTYTPASWM